MSQRKHNIPHKGAGGISIPNFEKVSRAYLRDLQETYDQAISSHQATPELSYRPALNEFFKNVSSLIQPDVESVFEPKNQAKSGRPDWRFHNKKTLGLYGYAEAKAFDTHTSIKTAGYKKQIGKYLDLGAKVVVTDGIEFIFYNPGGRNKKLSLLRKPLTGADWSKLMPDPRVESQFRDFFNSTISQPTSEESLVKELAKRAVEMSKAVRELAGLRVGQGTNAAEDSTIGALYELQMVLRQHHDPSLNTPSVFGDFVAQVLAFSLLYAHRVVGAGADTPFERRDKIVRFWASSSYDAFKAQLGPFRAIIGLLATELNSTGPLGGWYQDTLMFLSHVRLEKSQTAKPDYHVLYQTFLDAFDPQAKFDFGTYYTPIALSDFTVRLTEALVNSKMEGRNLYDVQNKLIDPCCGTGTFLEQLISYAPNASLPKIIGFEILPAPYALSHYRLAALPIDHKQRSNISVILTNTLSDELEREVDITCESNVLSEEQDKARKLAQPPLMLVIGNPPSSDSYKHADGDQFRIINRLIDEFRPPVDQRTTRQNIQKQLGNNPFVKFLRWSCEKLTHHHPGVFALVLPSSFLSHPTYRFARKWIISHFPKMWVLDLDADLRRRIGASNLFNTQQGRALVVGMTSNVHDSEPELYYSTMTKLSREEKIAELTRERTPEELVNLFTSFELDKSTYQLKPGNRRALESYQHFWPLYSAQKQPASTARFIFARICSGIKLAPSSLFVHVNKGLLLRRSRDVADETQTVDAVLAKWFSGNPRRPQANKLSPSVREGLRDDLKENIQVSKYSYRPFLNPFILLSKRAIAGLASIKDSGTRLRPEVVAAFEDEATIGISVAPAPEDIGDTLHRFVSFCWYFPDNDLCARGNAKIFCNQYPEYKPPRGGKWEPKSKININDILLRKVMDLTNLPDREAADALVYYVYAVMSANEYLTEVADALFRTADPNNPPRIPITQSPERFRAIVRAGRALAELEKPQEESSESSFSELITLFKGPFRLTKFNIDSDAEKIFLFQDSEQQLTIGPISKTVLDYEMGGYQVIQQWLKLYTYPFLRADFTEEHFRHLLVLLSQIEKQIAIIKDLDSLVSPILNDTAKLFSAI